MKLGFHLSSLISPEPSQVVGFYSLISHNVKFGKVVLLTTLFLDNFSPTVLLDKTNKQTLSPWGSWHSNAPSFLTPVILPHSWISFATKILTLGDPYSPLSVHTPRSLVLLEKLHTWKHVNITGHQPPCCLDTAQSLLLLSFGQISLPSPQRMFQTIGALLVFTQPPLPFFSLFIFSR